MEIGSQLIDSVYEAAVVPELWPSVLGNIAAQAHMLGGGLIALPSYVVPMAPNIMPKVRWTTSRGVTDMYAAFFGEGWLTRCDWVQRARALQHPFFIADQDLFRPGEFEGMPSYRFYRRFGIGSASALYMSLPSSDLFTFTFERAYEEGPVPCETLSFLNDLRPHLARAAFISARLGLERAKAATTALSVLGLPAAILCPQHRIIDANDRMSAFMPRTLCQGGAGRLHLADRQADALFSSALAEVAHQAKDNSVLSMPIPAAEEHPAAVLHVLPIRGSARDLFVTASCMIVITPLAGRDLPSANVIQGLFDLTAAEARVARLIASGKTIADVAETSATSEGTVRAQLKAIFAKTGVSRQAELVRLLGFVALGPGKSVQVST